MEPPFKSNGRNHNRNSKSTLRDGQGILGPRRVFYDLKTKQEGIDYPIRFYQSFLRLTAALLV